MSLGLARRLLPLVVLVGLVAARPRASVRTPAPVAEPPPARSSVATPDVSSLAAPEPENDADLPTEADARCPPERALDTSTLASPLALMLLVGERPRLFGSASLGTPTRGSLWGGVELRESDDIERAGGYPWGTETAVRSIERAAREVRRCHPGSPRLVVGDLSRQHGGWLRPHRSHQSGLDADVGYFHRGPSTWYQRVAAATFDAPRTWTLVRALIEGGNVDTLFIDASVQRLLRAHIETLPEAERGPENLFTSPTRREALIRHAWGHATHLHVRFRDEGATRLGARLARARPPNERRW